MSDEKPEDLQTLVVPSRLHLGAEVSKVISVLAASGAPNVKQIDVVAAVLAAFSAIEISVNADADRGLLVAPFINMYRCHLAYMLEEKFFHGVPLEGRDFEKVAGVMAFLVEGPRGELHTDVAFKTLARCAATIAAGAIVAGAPASEVSGWIETFHQNVKADFQAIMEQRDMMRRKAH